ncbi:FtsX-like permease family protein [Isoptericola sp. BMS4]|uniref:FtsX-like permease family protein n=1 Tax=Isoptericola sp. BMS4 TaxID=2527875 RepID=UPI00141E8F46|nr:FtsX-like permease family protein [Isoptericola sp. BMS4]
MGRLDYDLDGDGDGTHPIGPSGRRHELVVDVPDRLRGDLRLVGLDVLAGGGVPWDTRVGVTVDAVRASGDPAGRVTDPAETAWAPVGPDTRTATVPGEGPGDEPAGLGAVLAPADRETTPYRVLARGVGEAPARAVVTTSLADRLDLGPGDRVELPVGRTSVPVEVTGVVAEVPGAGRPDAALADLAGVEAGLVARVSGPPQPAETWVGIDGAGSTAAVARALRAEVPSDGTVTVTTRPDVAPAVDAAAPVRAAFGVAAAGAALLAVVGLLAVASAALRARRPEVAVLRAVGVPPRVQGRLRAAEQAWVAVVSVLLGAAAGAAAAALTVPGLAGAALVGTGVEPVPVLTLAARDTAVPLATLLLGVVAVLAVTYARVVAQARDGSYREEVR